MRTCITVLALMFAATAAAQEQPKTSEQVKAQSDLVAAIECAKRDFPFMVRLSRDYVLCLASNAGTPNAIRVQDVLDKAMGQ